MTSPFLTVPEFAKYLRMHPCTLYGHLQKGRIPGSFKVGAGWRISVEKFEEAMAEETK